MLPWYGFELQFMGSELAHIATGWWGAVPAANRTTRDVGLSQKRHTRRGRIEFERYMSRRSDGPAGWVRFPVTLNPVWTHWGAGWESCCGESQSAVEVFFFAVNFTPSATACVCVFGFCAGRHESPDLHNSTIVPSTSGTKLGHDRELRGR